MDQLDLAQAIENRLGYGQVKVYTDVENATSIRWTFKTETERHGSKSLTIRYDLETLLVSIDPDILVQQIAATFLHP